MAAHQQEVLPSNPLLGAHEANDEAAAVPPATADIHSSSQHSSQEKPHEKDTHQEILERHRQDLPKPSVFKLWWMELLSITFSLMCLATNAGVLVTLNGKRYESWKIARVNVTPNTIVSIVATFTKASLLLPVAEVVAQLKWLYFQARTQRVSDLQIFDDARSGPLGSLRLLWRVNVHSTIASLAAIVTVLALAIEPFTQQIVRYPTRQSMTSNISATIGATSFFDPTALTGDTGLTEDFEVRQFTELQELSIAADSGISNPAANALHTCPSGSCTWPAFSTLALCSSCKDITPYITVKCSNNTRNYLDRFCTYTLAPPVVSIPQMMAWNLWVKTHNSTSYGPTTELNISKSEVIVDDNYDNYVYEPGLRTWVDVVRFNESYASLSYQALDDLLPTILQCKFKWCAQYHGSTKYENGTLFDIPEFNVPMYVDNPDLPDPDTGRYLPNITGLSPAQAQQFSKTTRNYEVNTVFAMTFFNLLVSSLQNSVFRPVDELGVPSSNKSELLPSNYRPEYDAITSDQAQMGRSYSLYYANGGDLSKTMDNIARSVTSQIRSSANSINVTGTAEYTVVYIEVVWPWFIYSAVLLIAAAVLLGATIWLSHGNDKIVWKSSSLALLFHGLPEGDMDGMVLSTAKMEKIADGIWARLSGDETGNFRLKIS